MNLHAISFLWFSGYTLNAIPHSPVVEAITALRLYLLQWIEIEKVANEFEGLISFDLTEAHPAQFSNELPKS